MPVVSGLPGGPRRPLVRPRPRCQTDRRGRCPSLSRPGCLLRLRTGHENPRAKSLSRTDRGDTADDARSRGSRSMTLAIGVDVGGTKVAAGGGDEQGRILAKLKRSTPAASPARTEQAIADVVTELLAQVPPDQITAIGLGAAGFVDSARATMLFAPNLAWRDEPLKQRVEAGRGGGRVRGPRCCPRRPSPGATSR